MANKYKIAEIKAQYREAITLEIEINDRIDQLELDDPDRKLLKRLRTVTHNRANELLYIIELHTDQEFEEAYDEIVDAAAAAKQKKKSVDKMASTVGDVADKISKVANILSKIAGFVA
ncbi:MAG: hypothetical protein HRU20_29205 [Pseudomonadales bacterium]|nr:hypothetical protein [Pseudomonadales bacterium]